jgi:16S rRNA processing protein RimM
VAAESHTDVEGRFTAGMRLWALAEDGSRRALQIEELWLHKHYLIFKFTGVDSISDAEKLAGCELQVPREERAQLDSGWTYVSELTGCKVFDGDRELGIVSDVRLGAGEAPLLVVKAGTREYEIPFAEAYLQSLDVARKKIWLRLPEGMLEVNAPLTKEEKEQQKKSSRKSSS